MGRLFLIAATEQLSGDYLLFLAVQQGTAVVRRSFGNRWDDGVERRRRRGGGRHLGRLSVDLHDGRVHVLISCCSSSLRVICVCFCIG